MPNDIVKQKRLILRGLRAQLIPTDYDHSRIDVASLILPSLISLQVVSKMASIFALAFLSIILLANNQPHRYSLRLGPIILFVFSSVMVLIRPEPRAALIIFLLVLVILVRVVSANPAAVIIRSTVDGIGLFLLLNVIAFVLGLRTSVDAERVFSSIEWNGFVRTTFPLSAGLDAAPSMAGTYLAAFPFLFFHRGTKIQWFRLVSFSSALIVLFFGAVRTGFIIAIAIPVAMLVFPVANRWLARALTVFAAFSAIILPSMTSLIAAILGPAMRFIPGRDKTITDTLTLSSRTYIWPRSIDYWRDFVTDFSSRLFGFGQSGQIKSGVWTTYGREISVVTTNVQNASLHNSFLQQLFDGGILGWLLFTLGILWTSYRLSSHENWGGSKNVAIAVISASLISGISSGSISPGLSQYPSFWIVFTLIAISTQSTKLSDVT